MRLTPVLLSILFWSSAALVAGAQEFMQLQREFSSTRPTQNLAMSADEAIIAVGMQDGENAVIELRDRQSTRVLGRIISQGNELQHLKFHPTRRQLFVGGNQRLEFWKLDELPGSEEELPAAQFREWERPVNQNVAKARYRPQSEQLRWVEGQQMYEADTQPPYAVRLRWTGEPLAQPLANFAFNADESRLALSYQEQPSIRVLNPIQKQPLPPLDYHLLPPVDFHFSGSQQLVSIDEERNLFWGNTESRLKERSPTLELVDRGKPQQLLPLHNEHVALITTDEDDVTRAHILDAAGAEQRQLLLHSPNSIASSPTGAYLLSADYNDIQIYKTREHQSPQEYVQQLQQQGATETARRYRNHLEQPVALSTSAAGPSSLELKTEELRVAEQERDWIQAERLAKEVLREDPGNALALGILGRMQGNEDQVQLEKGRQLINDGLPEDAISQLKQISPESPLYGQAREQISLAETRIRTDLRIQNAQQQMRLNNWKGARTFLQLAQEQDPNNPEVQALLEEVESAQRLALLRWALIAAGILGALGFLLFLGYRRQRWLSAWIDGETGAPVGRSARTPPPPPDPEKERQAAEAHAQRQAEARARSQAEEKRFQEALQTTHELLRAAKRKDTEHQHTKRLLDFAEEIQDIARQAKEADASFAELTSKLHFLQQTLRSLKFYVRARKSSPRQEGSQEQKSRQEQSQQSQQQRKQQQEKQQQKQQAPSPGAELPDYYAVLGVAPQASPAEIRKAYHQKLKEYHPDRHQNTEFEWVKKQAEEMTRMLGEAYDVLMDESSRQRYDQQQAKRNS